MEKYNILYLDDEALYLQGSPVIVKKRAIVNNNETGSNHVQLKLQSVSDKRIALLKAKIFLYDIIGREVDVVEKQYLDLNVKNNEDFGSDVSILINAESARKLDVSIIEVCFYDGTIWTGSNEKWESVPTQKLLSNIFDNEYVVSEFQKLHGENAKYEILPHKDLWFCSCGYINHESQEKCSACNLNKYELQNLNIEAMRINGIYDKAKEFVNSDKLEDIENGISLLEQISEQVDCSNEIEKAREKHTSLKKAELIKAFIAKKNKRKKKLIISIAAISIAVICLVTFIISSISLNNKRKPFYALRDYAIENGTYYEEDNEYLYLLISLEEYHCFIEYLEDTETVGLQLYVELSDDDRAALTIEIDEKTVIKQEYKWTYMDTYGNKMEGFFTASELHMDMSLTYSDTNVISSSTRNVILEWVPELMIMYVALFEVAPNEIGTSAKDLGFPISKIDESSSGTNY